ncbi:MAG: AI-2E family transporter [Anaerolineae bacterium]
MNEPSNPTIQEADLGGELAAVWLAYLRGQLLLAIVIGLLTWAISTAIGLRYALLIGLVAGILETVPTLGPIIAALAGGTVAFIWGSSVIHVENWVFAMIVLGVFLLLQQLESWVLAPLITGKNLSMHPLLVLASVIVGGLIGGALIPVVGAILGAYLAVPVVASGRVILRHRQSEAPPPFE